MLRNAFLTHVMFVSGLIVLAVGPASGQTYPLAPTSNPPSVEGVVPMPPANPPIRSGDRPTTFPAVGDRQGRAIDFQPDQMAPPNPPSGPPPNPPAGLPSGPSR